MALSEDDNVIEALTAHATEKALTGRVDCARPTVVLVDLTVLVHFVDSYSEVHERSVDCRLENTDAGALGDAIELAPKLYVAITDDELGTFAERRELTQLLSSPGFAGLAGDSEVDDLLGVCVHDEEREQWPEPECTQSTQSTQWTSSREAYDPSNARGRRRRSEPDIVDLQKIASPHGVVGEKGLPALPVSWWTHGEDVPLDGALRATPACGWPKRPGVHAPNRETRAS